MGYFDADSTYNMIRAFVRRPDYARRQSFYRTAEQIRMLPEPFFPDSVSSDCDDDYPELLLEEWLLA